MGGGASNATYFMALAMRDLGHEITVLTAAFGDLKGIENEEECIEVHRISAKRKAKDRSNMGEMMSFVWSAFWNIEKIIEQRKIEKVIIFFSIPCGVLGPYIRWRWNLPYIISLRGGDVPGTEPHLLKIHRIIQPIRQFLLKESVAIVANSKGLATLSQKYDPYPVEIISNGVDTQFFFPIEKRNENFTFLFVGRFQPQKNIFILLNCFADLKNENVHLKIVGDGFQKDELQKFANELGISKNTEWLGWLDKKSLRNAYQQADCVLNPSTYEGMPNVLLEAMACGVPAIASNIMGNDEVVKDNFNGFLFDLSKSQEMTDRMSQILDRKTQKEFSINARKWVEENFSWHRVAEEYIELFNLRN